MAPWGLGRPQGKPPQTYRLHQGQRGFGHTPQRAEVSPEEMTLAGSASLFRRGEQHGVGAGRSCCSGVGWGRLRTWPPWKCSSSGSQAKGPALLQEA